MASFRFLRRSQCL